MIQNGKNSKRHARRMTKVQIKIVVVCMVRVLDMSVDGLSTSRYTVSRGSATVCTVTTMEISKVSGFFPDTGGPERFRETS